MASLNKVLIMGNLGKDPEVRHTQSGKAYATLNIATAEKWKDDMGNLKEITEWHRVIVWGKMAENCGKYLAKGRGCCVEGKLQTRKYQKKDGTEQYTTEIIAENVQFLPDREKPRQPVAGDVIDAQAISVEYKDADVPF